MEDIDYDDDEPKVISLAPVRSNMLWLMNIRGPLLDWNWERSPLYNTPAWEKAYLWATKTDQPLGLAISGPNRVGKTGLAVCAAREVSRHYPAEPSGEYEPDLTVWNILASSRADYPNNKEHQRNYAEGLRTGLFAPVYFSPWTQFEKLARRAMHVGCLEEFIFNLDERLHLLVLDDIDVGAVSDWREDLIYGVVDRPIRELKVIVTLNVLAKLSDRILARITNPSLFTLVEVK